MAGVLTVAAYICGRYEKEFGQKIDEMKLQKMMIRVRIPILD